MPATCVFCAIIRGEQPTVTILETERLIAFLDHRPLFRGHTLLVPKQHVRLLSDLPAEQVPEFFSTAQRLERAVEDGLGADGSMILINNVVSQSVPHLHLHVIPRSRGMACGSGSGRGIRTTTLTRLRPTRRRSRRPCPADRGRAEPRGASWRYGWVVGTGHGRTSMLDDPNGFARDLFDGLPARYDLLAELLSFGQNGQWRAEMVGHVIPADGVILDVASGTAGVALQLAARNADEHGRARVLGVDLTEPMLRQGRRRVAAAGQRDRIRLAVGRAERLPLPDASVDALTFTYLLRYVQDPQATLAELARVLKPGGTMASLEFCVPTGPVWHPAWWAYTRMVLPAGGLLLGGREWFRVGRFLGPNISAHYRRYPVSWTVQAWEKAGLTGVRTRVMSLGGGLVMWGTRAGG